MATSSSRKILTRSSIHFSSLASIVNIQLPYRMFCKLVTVLGLIAPILAAPAKTKSNFDIGFGIAWDSSPLPLLKLPYATYRAAEYNSLDDVYTFKNIRFAQPPTGALRWQKPVPPSKIDGIQDGSYGFQCYQAVPKFLSIALPFLNALEKSSEDCLFLDVVVPGSAVRGEVKNLPVMFWIFGGGYALGSKSFFLYDGHPLVKSSRNNMIYVAPNYRLGAFGWLGGPTAMKEGVANAALWDQKLALQWVQDNIGLFGGDKTQVTAMGESAGAGSIMHHLIAGGGTIDPLFKRAIMQSPAYFPQYDMDRLESGYVDFLTRAGCARGTGLSCLRGLTSEQLSAANIAAVGHQPYGTFGYGPAVDNTLIHDIPSMELAKGNFWKDISIIVSHNKYEGELFASTEKMNNDQFNSLIDFNYPNATADVRHIITKDLYPPAGFLKKYMNNYLRSADLIGQFVINCNVRYLAQAYQGRAWAYKFSIPPAIHAVDTILTFWRRGLDLGHLEINLDWTFLTEKNLATGFQSYLTSFVMSGNPNTFREKGGLPWTIDFPQAKVGDKMTLLNVNLLGFSVKSDDNTDQDRCDFWQNNAWTGRI